jgi:hypothetical protein
MAKGPYTFKREVHPPIKALAGAVWRLEFELADTANVSDRKGHLTILTTVSQPPPNHPQGLELAALQHVRALLGQQIKAMQSPQSGHV